MERMPLPAAVLSPAPSILCFTVVPGGFPMITPILTGKGVFLVPDAVIRLAAEHVGSVYALPCFRLRKGTGPRGPLRIVRP